MRMVSEPGLAHAPLVQVQVQVQVQVLTIIGAAHYPRQLVVEEDSADIVQMAVQGEQASPSLVRPDLDLVVITARHEPALVSVYSSAQPSAPSSMLTVVVSCGSRRHERGRRALRSGLSGYPYGSPIVELWRSVATPGSMA
jgi:hypothetical protein